MSGMLTPFEERTPLLGPTCAGPSSKILKEVGLGSSIPQSCLLSRWPLTFCSHHYDGQLIRQTQVYPIIHLIRVDVLSHIGGSPDSSVSRAYGKTRL